MAEDIYDKIMMLAKRRGYIYPSFDIYGGVAGFYDYGPLGAQLKTNVETLWRYFYLLKDNCVEIHTPTITLHEVLQASGHVAEFTDLTVDCIQCKRSYKVEDIIPENISIEQAIKENKISCPDCKKQLQNPYPVNLMFNTTIGIGKTRDAFLRPETAQGIFTNFHILYRYNREKLPCGVIQVGKGYRNEISPRQGTLRQREFSMAEAEIFVDPKDKSHPQFDMIKKEKLFLYDNKKEFTSTVEDAVKNHVINNQALAYYMYLTQDFLLTAGIDPKKFRFRKHADDELAHYATECWDAELYSERFNWVECVGIADRSAFDLNAHMTATGVDMRAVNKFDQPKTIEITKVIPKMDALGPLFKGQAGKIKTVLESIPVPVTPSKGISIELDGKKIDIPSDCYEIVQTKEKQTGKKFVPHVIEPSYGIDRILYMILEHNFVEEKRKDEEYRLLRLQPIVAPIKVGVFPLISDEKLVKVAKEIDSMLRDNRISTYYDEGGTIGRRYARMDEIGTPFCITVDHDTLQDKCVTIRDRDTTKQNRIHTKDIASVLLKKLH